MKYLEFGVNLKFHTLGARSLSLKPKPWEGDVTERNLEGMV
jgi:hypothetical protein